MARFERAGFRAFWKEHGTDVLVLAGILAVALILRLYRLDTNPAGLFPDEASKGPFALDILLRGDRPIFNESQSGREILLVYLEAISIAFFGSTATALRAPDVVAGTLAVLGLYMLVSESLRDADPGAARRTAFASAMSLALLYSHVSFSRSAFRGGLLPLFVVFLLYWLARAWRTNARGDFVWAGAVLGGSLYTYTAARFLPVLVVVLLLHQAVTARAVLAARLRGVVVMAAASLVVAGPLVFYFAQNPFAFTTRAGETSILLVAATLGGIAPALWHNIKETLQLFGQVGDYNWHYNLPGLPILDPWSYAAFLLGLGICCWRWRALGYVAGPVAVLVMSLPTLLSNEAGHALRSIGVLPAVALVTGIGLSGAWGFARGRVGRTLAPALALAVAAFFGASAVRTSYNYFALWPAALAARSDLPWTQMAVADYVNESDTDVYLGQDLFTREDTVVYLTGSRFPQRASVVRNPGLGDPAWLRQRVSVIVPVNDDEDGGFVLLSPPNGPGAGGWVYVLPPLMPEARRLVPPLLRENAQAIRIQDSRGVMRATAYIIERSRLPFFYSIPAGRPVGANFGDAIDLVGYDLASARLRPGDPVDIVLYWRARQPVDYDFDVSIQLQSAGPTGWASIDRPVLRAAFPTRQWLPGEMVPEGIRIELPKQAPAGLYRVMVSLERIWNRSSLTVYDVSRRPAPPVFLGPVRVVTAADTLAQAPENAAGAVLGGQIALTGYDLRPGAPGGELTVGLHWQALRAPDRDYTVFAHVLDASGAIVAQTDAEPGGGALPSSTWAPGEAVVDTMLLPLPAGLPPGEYSLVIGMYDLGTMRRLPVTGAGGAEGSADHFDVARFSY